MDKGSEQQFSYFGYQAPVQLNNKASKKLKDQFQDEMFLVDKVIKTISEDEAINKKVHPQTVLISCGLGRLTINGKYLKRYEPPTPSMPTEV